MDSLAIPPALHYQPRYDCRDGALVGAKLYVARPQRSDNVVLTALDDACLARLHSACRQVADWNAHHGLDLILTLGATLEVLATPTFRQALNGLILDARLDAHSLELNIITRTGEIPDEQAAALHHLKRCGVRFAISAASPANARLAWLRRLPVDCLEVPAALVQDVTADPEGVAIIRALVTRAHKMGQRVSAKGIADRHTAGVLVASDCDFVQGPLLGGPMTAEAFGALLAAGERLNPELIRGPRPDRTLLLVDDEENILNALRRLLRRDGYTLLTASSGQQALDLLATHPVDVIVSDQRMPGMTGVEFLRKAKDMVPDTVRMVLSGYTELQSVTDAINEGSIYKFLTKPWDDAMLRANIDEAFHRKALVDENLRLDAELHRANAELARINERLAALLAERERQLDVDESALHLTQAALAALPAPVLGTDPGGMIAFANAAADKLFPAHAPLIGLGVDEALPPDLRDLALRGEGATDYRDGARHFHVVAHPLHAVGTCRGTLLSFTDRSGA
ncbi:MAG TPA: EAL domain-containing protein [Zoogloea sp.]|uniref:EAL domain-containing protein n=1 Tax=Zoogloea sp. TaxID=49181 RepID=UPI002CD8F65D|nr:EAL domain-containing protein [Zoogloea sp.]HMV17415.1 EAL domain-containing protein [Rhodocyclaceae bacterium]HMV63194.1 EAL domain-containing protein [Rhodocyclaceae bacterium]HMZ75198.1 EAL domain-containing protein [Rhodocyclaceae bacterium]HNA67818.1 EAL domain-containing protein [Rhodocyclaceae bacterium]HND23249.1 EAL domain-containing protein [Rhodocyclaceae bacterium]